MCSLDFDIVIHVTHKDDSIMFWEKREWTAEMSKSFVSISSLIVFHKTGSFVIIASSTKIVANLEIDLIPNFSLSFSRRMETCWISADSG
jgi:hypothetical protein